MEVAKKFGCRSQGECEAICRDPQSEQCQELMRELGIESQFGPPPGLDDDFGGGPGGFGGPGGCKSREECEAFCRDNPEECQQFRPSPGGMGDFGEFEDRAAREEFFEGVRSEHVENVKRDSPEILRCLEEKVGSEVFGRRQAGRISDEAEGRLVKETLLACGAAVAPIGSRLRRIWRKLRRSKPKNSAGNMKNNIGSDLRKNSSGNTKNK